MFKWTLLLVIAGTFLVSSDALAPRPEVKQLELSGNDDKRSLRGLKTTDNAANEERGGVEVAEKLMSALGKTNISQELAKIKQARLEKREALVQKLLDGTDYAKMYKNKVSEEEVYKVLRITADDIPFGNPALMTPSYRKAIGYTKFVEKAEKTARGF